MTHDDAVQIIKALEEIREGLRFIFIAVCALIGVLFGKVIGGR